jgi:hypothetical protein
MIGFKTRLDKELRRKQREIEPQEIKNASCRHNCD